MLQAFSESIATYRKGIKLISQHRLWSFLILPGLISAAVILLLLIGTSMWFANSSIEQTIVQAWPWDFGRGFIEGLTNSLVFLLTMVVVLFLGKYIVMVIVAPFMGPLSEKIEEIVQQKKEKSTANFFGDLIRGLRIAFRNIFLELIFVLLINLLLSPVLGFLNIIPILGTILATLPTFFIQAYFAGFGNMDYTLERKNFGVRDSVTFVRKNRWAAIGNGSLFLLIFLIPVIGWFLAPAYATVAATQVVLNRLEGTKV